MDFRKLYPDRRFCLLNIDGRGAGEDVREPPEFLAELQQNDKVTRHQDVPRDYGDSNLAADWFDMCKLGDLPKGSNKVALWSDVSRSLGERAVEASRSLFDQRLANANLKLVFAITTGHENWIDPFLIDF